MSSINSAGTNSGFPTNPIPTPTVKKEQMNISPTDASLEMVSQIQPAAATIKNPEEAMKELQRTINAIQGPQKSLEVSVHEETHAIMIKVKNKDTGEIIREAPPEKVLDAVAKLMEVSGLIVDKKV